MNILKRILFFTVIGLILTSCDIRNPSFSRPYLHQAFPLKQTMYVCQVQYRDTPDINTHDRFFMRDQHDFNTLCEDSMFSIAYRTKPSVWHNGHGDSIDREWLIARLPKGTLFVINEYKLPVRGENYTDFPEAYITIASGPYAGLAVEWPWFDIIREINRPCYPYMGCQYEPRYQYQRLGI